MIKVEAENVQDLVSKLGVIFQAVLDKFPDKYQDFPDFLKDVEVTGMSAIDVHSAVSMLVEFDWKKFNTDLQNKVSEDKIWELVRAVDVWAGSKGLSFVKIISPYDITGDYEGDRMESSEWYPHLSEQDVIFLSNIFHTVIDWGSVEDEEFEWHTRENGFERDADDYCDLDNWWDENEEFEEATELEEDEK